MDRMSFSLGKVFAWVVVGGCSLVNLLLIGQAIELPTLSGAGAAQADLGLYLVLGVVGVPIVILSMIAIGVTFTVRNRSKGFIGVLSYNHGIGAVSFVNSLIPLGIWYWLVALWK